uniref:Myeloid-specific peroxidase n=1 Tax=Salarias fasciatus TaxID=181472 RepID=A0A672JIY3_SALFA
MHGEFHPKSSILRLYTKRKEGGRGLVSVRATIQEETKSLHEYTEKMSPSDDLLSECLRHQKPSKEEPEELSWTDKALHGMYHQQIEEVADFGKIYQWLEKAGLRDSTGALIMAAQEQVLNTRSIEAGIYHTTKDPRCRLPLLQKDVYTFLRFLKQLISCFSCFLSRKATRKGASNTPLVRWQPAEYDDGISEPKGNRSERINNFFLPLVRQVSNNILRMMDAEVVNDTEITRMVTIYSQWNDHDLSFTPFSPSIRSFSNGVNCDESCQRGEPCIPIPIPPGDPHLPTDSCIPAFRSAGACGTGFPAYNFSGTPNVRQQINAATAFLDISQVYGSEEKLALDLRNLTDDGGLLKVNEEFTDNGREVLPFHPLQVNACATRRRVTNDTNAREIPCFIAGDVRVDENAALTSLHTLFLREHNRLARELRRLNPQWDSETLYQEARKIMGAYTQVTKPSSWPCLFREVEAVKNMTGNYTGYNHSVDPSISNVFATAAYRFAHLAIQPTFSHLGANYLQDPQFGNIPVFEAFFTPWRILFEIGIDSVLRGLIGRPAELKFQNHTMVDALRERLFQFVQQIALDLGSLNMQRGRDHGLPGYNTWRKFCGLSQPRNQAELARVLNNEDLARSLFQHYGTPDNIDVWLAGVAEPFVTGGRVGSLFACLIARQFKNIRDGDRSVNVFSTRQRAALSRASLARIICDNTGITSMPRDVFSVISSNNSVTPCSAIPRLDLAAWKQRPCTGAGCSAPALKFLFLFILSCFPTLLEIFL